MRKLLLKFELDIEPFTWGGNDYNRRMQLRSLIIEKYPEFSPECMEQIYTNYTDIDVAINCYLKDPYSKDIDNLAKIPIDAIFFSAKDDSGKDEVGYKKKWESKITSLTIHKLKSDKNMLEIMIHGM